MNKNPKIRTHIDVLDQLLGSDLSNDLGCISKGSIILIRGEPGSGKTTLGLQIISEYIRSKTRKGDTDHNDAKPVFFSLERNPIDVLFSTSQKYNFFPDDKKLFADLSNKKIDSKKFSVNCYNLGLMEHMVRAATFRNKSFINILYDKLKIQAPKFSLNSYQNICESYTIAFNLADEIIKRLRNNKSEKIIKEKTKINKDEREDPNKINEIYRPIVFIDSLNVLMQLIRNIGGYEEKSERLLLNVICESVRKVFKDYLIIFTGEYHYKDQNKKTTVSESFFCDIEIALFSEPVVVSSGYSSTFESPLGSNTLPLIGPEIKSMQTQSFCRVLKSRDSANQTRRCAYDMVSGEGIEFYETFPGDGHLILFGENAQQKNAWKYFFENDLARHYPALRYDSFDRSSLQRTTSAQRRFRDVPARTDMYLASFDNYWINWYYELCLKSNVAEILQNELGIQEIKKIKKLQPLINDICSELCKTDKFNDFRKKNRIYYESIIKSIKEKIQSTCDLERESKEDFDSIFEEFLRHDLYDKHLALFFSELTRTEKIEDSNKQKIFNRPCLRCLWCRSLWQQLESEKQLQLLDDDINLNDCKKFQEICENLKGYLKSLKYDLESNYRQKSQELCEDLEGYLQSLVDNIELNDRQKFQEIHKKIKGHLQTLKYDSNHHQDSQESSCQKLELNNLSDHDACIWRRDLSESIKRHFLASFKKRLDKIIRNHDSIEDIVNDQLGNYSKKTLNDFKRIFDELISNNLLIQYKNDDIFSVLNKKYPGKEKGAWVLILSRVYYNVTMGTRRYQLVSTIPEEKLRLFGERKSKIIHELENHKLDSNRPIHRPGGLMLLRDQENYCSIPYDANIGFLVYRKDVLEEFGKKLKYSDFEKEYKKTLKNIIKNQYAVISKNFPSMKQFYVPEYDDLLDELINNLKNGNPPTTYEEIVAFHLVYRPQGLKYNFLIDCRSPDSFLSTMLEFLWNCGANLRISPDYKIEEKNDTMLGLVRAFYLLGLMFQNGIIPFNSTLEAEAFTSFYSKPKKSGSYGKKEKKRKITNFKNDWAFARHWYSTLIETLTARENLSIYNTEFLWNHENAELEIMPMPVSFSNYAKYKENVWHISCWGDWHLAMINGTENTELGIDLINNIMSSNNICERAFNNAGIPTVEGFYEKYGDRQCINLPERESKLIPKMTYEELRDRIFKHAKSRSQVFDYHHCMRELHSVMEYIHFKSQSDEFKKGIDKGRKLNEDFLKEIYKKLNDALNKIEKFKEEPFLLS